MAETVTRKGPTVTVSRDRMQVILRLPADLSPRSLSAASIMELLADSGISADDDTRATIESTVEKFNDCPRDMRVVIMQGIAPQRGADGRLEWQGDYGPKGVETEEDAANAAVLAATADTEPINYYDQSPFVSVKADEHIATLIDPEPGMPGYDVFGKRIPPLAGKAFPIRFDPTVRIDGLGRIRAVQAGLLACGYNTIHVSPVLEIPDAVNFTTGNVKFDGSVMVGNGVRDRFTIDATEDVVISGLVEAAHIRCKGTFRAENGMAGRGIGSIQVKQDVVARYLIGVIGHVGRDLIVQREIINCNLTVGRSLDLTGGSMIGGQMTVDGPTKLAVLGSDAGVATTLHLGHVPVLSDMLNKLSPALVQVDERLQSLIQEYEDAMSRPNKPTTRLDQLRPAIEQLTERRGQLTQRIKELREKFNSECRVYLEVFRMIHPGVTLVLPRARIKFFERLKGPFIIRRTREGKIAIDHADGKTFDMSAIARIANTALW